MLNEILGGALGETGMGCLICGLEIRQNDTVLLVTEVVYDGPCMDDITHLIGEDRMDGIVHLKCLQSSGDAARTPNTGVVEVVVGRSDALSLFGTAKEK